MCPSHRAASDQSCQWWPRKFRGRLQLLARAVAVTLVVALAAGTAHAQFDAGAFDTFVEGLWPDARAAGVSRAVFEAAFFDLDPDRSLPDLVPGAAKHEPKPTRAPKPAAKLGGPAVNDTNVFDAEDPAAAPEPATKEPAVVAANKGQAEFVKTAGEYLEPVRLTQLMAMGKLTAARWKADLDRIEQEYGVSRFVLLSIFGREFDLWHLRIAPQRDPGAGNPGVHRPAQNVLPQGAGGSAQGLAGRSRHPRGNGVVVGRRNGADPVHAVEL